MTLYAIGDLQGCARPFDALLEEIGFNPERDRLWLVGDLVNRGPDSLATLRRVIELGDAVTTVLGNHDLHLLAAVAGVRKPRPGDTFGDVLAAPDARELVEWLRHRPLLHHDAAARRVLVHAGIPPAWSIEDAEREARAVEAALRGRKWRDALAGMYGNEPRRWSPDLEGTARLRYTINALTRMRFCAPDGALDLERSGPPDDAPKGLVPWFDVPTRRTKDVHIVFGHWSALGVVTRDDITALDSGCVWGRALTAVPLDPPGPPIAVPCSGPKKAKKG
nr:diadenosine tetraphosphatase [Gammaproteobacteria bacterium]